ncbi:MAG: alpha/beta family hydrolase [Bacteroidota bacterium]
MTIFVDDKQGSVSALWNESTDPKYTLVLAHGAGAGMGHNFMERLATAISSLNGHVLRFNFPYMEQGKRAPGSPKVAQHAVLAAKHHAEKKYPTLPLLLSGKSYGGRMSSHLVADGLAQGVSGLVYFGFPLHAPGRDSKTRADHLKLISVPQLFIQGTKDKLANFQLIEEVVKEQSAGEIEVIEEGDHSFKVPKRTGLNPEQVIQRLADRTNTWALGIV